MIEDKAGPLCVSAIYFPPNHPPDKNYFTKYFKLLGARFLAGCDFNAKHRSWGSRLSPPGRRKVLHQVIQEMRLSHLSSYKLTYLSAD